MTATDWNSHKEVYVFDNGKRIPAAHYRRQQAYIALSDDAKLILTWLSKRKRPGAVSMVELSKCLTPLSLRKAAVIRQILAELAAAGFAEPSMRRIYYSGGWRQVGWQVDKTVTLFLPPPLPGR